MKTILQITCIFILLGVISSCEKEPVNEEIDKFIENKIVTPDFLDIIDVEALVVINDNSKLLKISKKDFSFTNFLPENQYDLFALSVSSDDVINFNALRYSDAKIVIGEIDETGKLTITKDDFEEPVTALVRIN